MRRQLTAIITALALAAGGIPAAPALAGDTSRDLAKFLIFTGLMVGIANSGHKKKAHTPARTQQAAPAAPRKKFHHHQPKKQFHHQPNRRNRSCIEDFWNGRRWVTFIDHRCRRAKGKPVFRSARKCLDTSWRRGRWVTTFDNQCMTRHGYSRARGL